MIDVVVLFFLLLPFFVCVCGAACRVLYFLFNLLVSVDHPENTPLCVFCSNFKIFRGLRNRLFFFLIGVSSIALFSSTWKGDFIYNYHWRCPFFLYLSWYCFASPKFLNWIPLSNFHFLFTQFMGRRFFLGRPNSTRRRTRPTLRFRSRQR